MLAGDNATIATTFPGGTLSDQLLQVAKVIKLRTSTGMSRQVFFCSLGGFDTHGSQSWQQWDLLRQLSEALMAFYNATIELGVADRVTSFTLSDFGRTLQPSGTGTDHGWGSHLHRSVRQHAGGVVRRAARSADGGLSERRPVRRRRPRIHGLLAVTSRRPARGSTRARSSARHSRDSSRAQRRSA